MNEELLSQQKEKQSEGKQSKTSIVSEQKGSDNFSNMIKG
jgi:hypothetical protein